MQQFSERSVEANDGESVSGRVAKTGVGRVADTGPSRLKLDVRSKLDKMAFKDWRNFTGDVPAFERRRSIGISGKLAFGLVHEA